MESKFWPPRPPKWPLDLEDLGRRSVIFSKNTFFKSCPIFVHSTLNCAYIDFRPMKMPKHIY